MSNVEIIDNPHTPIGFRAAHLFKCAPADSRRGSRGCAIYNIRPNEAQKQYFVAAVTDANLHFCDKDIVHMDDKRRIPKVRVLKMRDEQRGFSLIETMVVCIVASILAVMSIPLLKTSMDQSNANASAQLIAQQLNLARALAVGTHSNILVQFDSAANTVVIAPGTGSMRGPFVLPGNVKLMTISPNQDTPDALGSTLLGTSGHNQITFLDNGSAATDGTGTVLCSGTFFVRHASGDPATIRAVTLLGGTGRVRTWQYNSTTSTWE